MFDALKNKNVLVTGATGGIGAEIAILFGYYGAFVGIHYNRNRKKALELRKQIEKRGGQATLVSADLMAPGIHKRLIGEFVREAGGIDVLVNNAGGYAKHVHFLEIDEKNWNETIALNARAPFFLSREAFKHMMKRGWGRIVNIGSTSVKYVGARSLHYATSKAALDAITRGFAREGAEYGILVNAIRCGVIKTAMHKGIKGYSEQDFRKRIGLIPLGRMGTPIEIARAVVFLASDGGDYITGQVLDVAGGD